MSILSQYQIASLTLQEKVSLIDELWASLDCSEVGNTLDTAYDRMLERRLAACDQDMDVLITLDRASQQLRSMLNGTSTFAASATDAA
jgi:putative addiction module component (TIGR02574 family)